MGNELPAFMEHCVKDLATELLRRVRLATPVEENTKFKYYGRGGKIEEVNIVGGELRRGWTAGKDMDEEAFINVQKVEKHGGTYAMVIENNVSYAPFVEYGYRQKPRFVPMLGQEDENGVRTGAYLSGKKIEGQHMLKNSANEVSAMTPARLEYLLNQWLKERWEM